MSKWTVDKSETVRLADKLRKYSKEQIITAISRDFQAEFILGRIINDIEQIALSELLEEHEKAIEEAQNAGREYINWQSKMCDEYGDGKNVKILDIPTKEIDRGVELETSWRKARKKERLLDKKVNKMLNIGE